MFRLESTRQAIQWWRREAIHVTDLAPPYQRKGGQWSKPQKSYLIDSILNGFDLPKFYLADFTHTDSPLNVGKQQFAIIDGRQRLEAITEFVKGSLKLDRGFTFLDDPTLKMSGMGFSDLTIYHPELASKFDDYQLDVVFVATNDEARVNDLFIRLNSGTGLTGAQVRNAMQGRWPAAIRDVAEHVFFTSFVSFPRRQGQDLNVAAKLLMLEFRGSLNDTKKRQLDTFVKSDASAQGMLEAAQTGAESIDRSRERVEELLQRMTQIFVPNDPLLRTQGPITVYYWLVRHLPSAVDPQIRPFLTEFEARRQENRRIVSRFGTAGPQADKELVAYDQFRRNANDRRSIEGMFETLLRRFRTYAVPVGGGALVLG